MDREGLDHYSSSVVALDGDSGEVVWHFRMVYHDLWDYDTPAQPTLMELRKDGETIPVVVQVMKMGMTFVLNRETGEPVYPVEERPVPQQPAPGEYLSPTQPFPTHAPHLLPPISADDAWGFTFWDRGACRDRLNELRNDGIYTPPTLEGSILYPSNGGGNNWGSPANMSARASGIRRPLNRAPRASGRAYMRMPAALAIGWMLCPALGRAPILRYQASRFLLDSSSGWPTLGAMSSMQ